MFWNTEFVDSTLSHIDVVLQMPTVKLSDILFEDDLLQELKTSNINLDNFLTRPEVIAELVDNIIKLTERDCCDKSLYSNVHAAYISCEILTGGTAEIYAAFMDLPESLTNIISCLTVKPKQQKKQVQPQQKLEQEQRQEQEQELEQRQEQEKEKEQEQRQEQETQPVEDSAVAKSDITDDDAKTTTPAITNNIGENVKENEENQSTPIILEELKEQHEDSSESDTPELPQQQKDEPPTIETVTSQVEVLSEDSGDCDSNSNEDLVTKVVPQKATLVSKLISNIHSLSTAKLSCHITQDIDSFSRLINLLVQNIDISGAFEILSTFIKRTEPPEFRYVFCEILSNLSFVQKLIDVMTLSDNEDKQRNACQLLCDIIVIGRQDASEQTSGPKAQDMLSELIESNQATHVMLEQMFLENMRNTTAIVCGMKVLQILLENKSTAASAEQTVQQQTGTIEKIQEEIEKYLIKFHELLLNPPKQEPIRTTFGVIQKPLGYMRLEVVNLIRALIITGSPNVIRKLVELGTMKVIIDLFIEYSWNNLLHTQVEQTLCSIINNCRKDEEEFTLGEFIAQCAELPQQQQQQPRQEQEQQPQTQPPQQSQSHSLTEPQQNQDQTQNQQSPSVALLSQLLNECDLIGRLLMPSSMTSQQRRNGEQANFGHIIQMINSIAINRDLDTIREHLNEVKEKRPDLYDRWTTFVNVDVASFKEISLYYDAQSAINHVDPRFNQMRHNQIPDNRLVVTRNDQSMGFPSENGKVGNHQSNNNADDQLFAYFSFTKEDVLPTINVGVLTEPTTKGDAVSDPREMRFSTRDQRFSEKRIY